jgi:hypothetical protein
VSYCLEHKNDIESARILRVGTEMLDTYSLLAPSNAHIIQLYISPYPTATCFGWSPTSGSSQPNEVKYILVY